MHGESDIGSRAIRKPESVRNEGQVRKGVRVRGRDPGSWGSAALPSPASGGGSGASIGADR